MKTILLILTIAGAAGAQALTGLPGLTLTGDPTNPLLTNHSGKTLIAAVVVRYKSSNSPDLIDRVSISPVSALPLKDGEEALILKGRSNPNLIVNGYNLSASVFLSAALDLAVFIDGQVIGPDKFSSQSQIADSIATLKQMSSLSTDQLSTVLTSSPATPLEHMQQRDARNLLARPDLRAVFAALPEKLWRQK
jgi:hypothetical protein